MKTKASKSETIWQKSKRLARRWSRSKPHSDAQYRVVREIDSLTLLLLFVDDIRDIHEASDSESGFNHEIDTLSIILQDAWSMVPKASAIPKAKWEARECATLGTYFADVYKNNELFAMQVPRPLAKKFVADPHMWGNAHAPIPLLRTWAMEHIERLLEKHTPRVPEKEKANG